MLVTLFKKYRYYNTPDGHEPFVKVVSLCKYGFCSGLVLGIHRAVMRQNTSNFMQTVQHLAYHTVPYTSACFTFASSAFILTKLRGKDDLYNYFFSSVPVGLVWYKCRGNASAALLLGFALLPTSFIFRKAFGDCGFNGSKIIKRDFVGWDIDWTITKDIRDDMKVV